MRISDWSSDVCSSDLLVVGLGLLVRLAAVARGMHVGGTAGEQQAVERVQQVAHLLALRHGRDDDRRAAGGFPDGAGILVADHVLARVVVAAEIGGKADERAPHAARAFFLYRQDRKSVV